MSFTLRLELQSANISRSNWRSNTEEAVGVIQRSVLSHTDSTCCRRHSENYASTLVGIFRCAGCDSDSVTRFRLGSFSICLL